jgi:hypothetical protein
LILIRYRRKFTIQRLTKDCVGTQLALVWCAIQVDLLA